MYVTKYSELRDEDKLMELIKNEGEEWACYSSDNMSEKYKAALSNSINYVAYEENRLCGYSRSVNDNDFYIYVCDLLVDPNYRGHSIGFALMECIYKDFPEQIVYVMSDVDGYYKKLGYKIEGSVFEVNKN